MLFNSLQFLVFFVFVSTAYFLLAHRYRWILLLVASCFFYMSFIPVYILILGVTILIDYYAGLLIEGSEGPVKKQYLVLSLLANTGALAIFKYYNFFSEQINTGFSDAGLTPFLPALEIILPIGLSFHTFQAMSYTIEVYRGHQKAEKNAGIFALYVLFYPQLVAGPIERPQNLLHQFYEKHTFDAERIKSSISLMIFGFFKKVVIADRLAMLVDAAYGDPVQQSGLSLLIATFFYAFQIYCDFSGYADIAIGAARIMGFRLMENFNNPYLSTSLVEFWRRWHISLSSWFRDYLYIPLGGNRVRLLKQCRNLLIVFAISGIWHGANYTFLAWGLTHGILLCTTLLFSKTMQHFGLRLPANRLSRLTGIAFTFTGVCVSWVFFRAENMKDALLIFSKIAAFSIHEPVHPGLNVAEFIFSGILILFLIIKDTLYPSLYMKNNFRFFSVNIFLLALCYFFGVFNLKQFIYFQF